MRGGSLAPCALEMFAIVGWIDMKPYLIKGVHIKLNATFEELKINIDPKSTVCIPKKKP